MDVFEKLQQSRQFIEPALEYAGGTHVWDDIATGVLNGRYQLWVNDRCAIITEIVAYPQKLDLHFFLVGGSMEALSDIRPQVEEWGKENGCITASCAGRKGWLRSFMVEEGYEQRWVVMSKELGHE